MQKRKLLSVLVGQAVAALATVAAPVYAQDSGQATERVTITGSSIKRIDAETALPVQVISREEIAKIGAQSTEELLATITATSTTAGTQVSNGSGATTGGVSTVSLRGLGATRTLVLINGRRAADFGGVADGAGSGAADINAIPIAAIERVEVLKDGASAVYGSDAVAGVVNFILRSNYTGAEVGVQYGTPTRSGGAQSTKANAMVGAGDFNKDGYNILFNVDYDRQTALYGRDRDFAKSSVNVGAQNDTTSGNTFPANLINAGGASRSFLAPAYAGAYGTAGCAPSLGDDPMFANNRCRFDPAPYVALTPDQERLNGYLNGRLKLSADTELYGELGASRNTVKTTIQPAPVSDVFQLPAGNPQIQTFRNFANNTTMTGGAYAGQTLASALEGIYGPNGGGAYGPNVAQFLSGWSTIVVLPTSAYYPHQFVADGKLSGLVDGDPLIARYRTFDNGLRSIKDENTGYRAVVGLKGVIAGFDYDIGFATAQSENKEYTTDGYAQLSKLLPLLNSGVVNLFGPNTPDVLAQIKATNFNGLAFSSKTNTTGIDGKISKEIAELENGPVNFAAGLAYRQEKYDFTASEATMTGDVSGYGGNYLPVSKSRDVTSAYAEVSAPIVKKLEADLAVRYDNYAGVGNTTNPKVSLRWQPVQQVLVRGAYGTGFRAPSLTNLYAPQVTGVTQNGVSDPLADCSTGNTRDCSTQFALATGGNANLKPEKSESKTLGMFFEPNKDFHVGFDVFDIKVKDQIVIGNISYLYYLGSPALAQQYSYLITRDAQGHIISLNGINANIGTTRTNGIDVDAKARFASSLGKFTFALNGTYVNKYELSRPDGTVSALADANAVIDQANGPVLPRWKHVASLTLDSAPWSVTLIDNFQSGYHDLISDFGQDGGHIGAYETFDLQGSYTGFKDLTITAGVRNLLDKNPPYSNTGGQVYFQAGYDAGYGDPRGRFVYLALNWKIK